MPVGVQASSAWAVPVCGRRAASCALRSRARPSGTGPACTRTSGRSELPGPEQTVHGTGSSCRASGTRRRAPLVPSGSVQRAARDVPGDFASRSRTFWGQRGLRGEGHSPGAGTVRPQGRGALAEPPACTHLPLLLSCPRHPHPERDGVEAAAPGHRVLRHRHDGRDPEPREGFLPAGRLPAPLRPACSSVRWQTSSVAVNFK